MWKLKGKKTPDYTPKAGRLRDIHNHYHITIKGHQVPNLYNGCVAQFYCFEEENEKHTHIGLELTTPESGNIILNWIKNWDEETKEPDVKWHRNFASVVGYHYGIGGKPPCMNVIWQAGTAEHFLAKNDPYSYDKVRKAQKVEELTDYMKRPGQWKQIMCDFYMIKEPEELKEIPIKDRHICCVGPSNCGKSLMVSENFRPYYLKSADQWWDGYNNEPYVWFDEVTPQWTLLKQWTNNARQAQRVQIKGASIWLRPDVTFFMTLNHNPYEELFKEEIPDTNEEKKAFNNRFKRLDPAQFRTFILRMNPDKRVFIYCIACKEMRWSDHTHPLETTSPTPTPTPTPTLTPSRVADFILDQAQRPPRRVEMDIHWAQDPEDTQWFGEIPTRKSSEATILNDDSKNQDIFKD